MIAYINNWLVSIQAQYGVNPIIFALIYCAGVIPFWLSIYRIIAGLKTKNFKQVRTFSIILGIVIIAPFTYVAVFGRNLPFYFWIIVAAIILYSVFSVVRRIRSAQ